MFCKFNLGADDSIATMEGIFRRAKASGYNKVLLGDTRYGIAEEAPPNYFRNVERVKELAARHKLEIVPTLFPIGYSERLLWHDPNLAEALPVRGASFVVRHGEARLEPDPAVTLRGGDFSDRSQWDHADATVKFEDGVARVTDPRGRNARVFQRFQVKPFRQYHVSVRVKTQQFEAMPEIKVLARPGSHPLQFAHLGVKRTQDWTTHHAVFNSLDNDEVTIYLGVWEGTTGTLWWDDAKIEEVGLLNVVRRDGAPLVVTREDGTPLAEGREFEPVHDPRMGCVPYKGCYEVWHEPPVIRTKLPDGTRLRVSYFHAITIHDGQVMICPSEPKTVEWLRAMASRVHKLWGAKAYWMNHDEIRVLNWDESCRRRHLDAGAIVADNVKTCVQILREVNPGGRIYVWSDMFDPNHNARDNYYLVRGDLRGAWDGLDREVIIAAWHRAKAHESLPWFAKRGHRIVIAGYYDEPPERSREWLTAARRVDGVIGVMYTTWQKRYDDLEPFGVLMFGPPPKGTSP